MAVNPRFEISSSSADGVPFGYSNTHRSHFLSGPNIERGSSFRENHDGRLVLQGVTGANFSGSSTSGHGELKSLSDVLLLRPVPSGEQMYARQLELRKAISAAVGMSGEEQLHGALQSKPLEVQGHEELKRIKASLSDNITKARERSQHLSDAISKLDKYKGSTQTRKRVRPETSERTITSLPVERPATAGKSMKASFCASPNHANIADTSTPKAEDKNKGVVPNKRVRTSMVDVRVGNASGFQRTSGLAERDRDSFKSSGSLAGSVDEKDRIVSNSSEGWEKTKMKGRRSGNKSDSVAVTPANGNLDEREHKWGAQHRNSAENRSRPSEGHGFRSGPVHGIVSMHKVETAQQNTVAMRSVNRSESDGSPSIGEKGDRFVVPEKERSLPKNGVRLSHREDGPLPSPSAVTKAKAARAPRSSTGVSVNPSAHAPRLPPSADVWDRAPSRAQLPVGPSNRKRPAPSRSSSPPVAQWVGQRHQKMARIARTNLVSPVGPIVPRDEAVSIGEGSSARDGTATVAARSSPSMSAATGLARRVANTATLSQSKPKSERINPSTAFSESDDSEGGDIKSKEKGKKHIDSEGRFAAVSQKMGPLVIPGKKSRVGSKEEGGDGVRRQGRSGRGLIANRESPIVTQVEKMDISANAKQLRSARPGLEKLEKSLDIKPGRPSTKKGTGERKSLTRPRRPADNGTGDISGESDDDREEMVAAVQAAVNASVAACPNNFWKQLEPFFAYLTADEHENLKRQVKEMEEAEMALGLPSSIKKSDKVSYETDTILATPPESPLVNISCKVPSLANGSMEFDGVTVSKFFNNLKDKQVAGIDGRKGLNGGCSDKGLPLSQRLLAALIIEGDSDDGSREDGSQNEWQASARDDTSHDLSDSEQVELVKKEQDSESEVEMRRRQSKRWSGLPKSAPHEDFSNSNGHRDWDSATTLHKLDQSEEVDILISPENHLNCLDKDERQALGSVCDQSNWDVDYQSLKLDERIALELQSVGLYPDLADVTAKEDDEIAEELERSHIELKDQVHVNKERVTTLERAVSTSREAEEREREHLAMVKLVEVAFIKRMGSRGGALGASGNKSSASKSARSAALSFAKRTLARWKHFEDSGQSCFADAGLRDILFCVSSKDGEVKTLTNGGESWTGFNANATGMTLTASEGIGQMNLRQMSGAEKADKESSESGQIAATYSDRMGEKDDVWTCRPKEREVLLEDVVGNSVVGNNLLAGTKGKRSERERDGKSQCKEISGRSDSNKSGQQGLGTIKGERKTKTKPRQRTAPLLKAVNNLLGKPAELPKESTPMPSLSLEKPVDRFMKAKDGQLLLDLGGVQEPQPEAEAGLDLSHFQIPSMDELVVNGDLGGQGQDLGSWLDFEDPGLVDAGGDFMGLDVPMDDLADLTMMM